MTNKDGEGERDGKDGKVWNQAGRVERGLTWLRCILTVILPILPVFPVPPVLAQADIGRRIEARLNTLPFNRQLWGIALADENGRMIYGRNESRLFIPASNTKLIVGAVASALLPPEWRAKTSLYGGPVVGGVLQ